MPYNRERHLQTYFCLSPQDVQAILEFQGNVCAVCKRPFTRSPNIDHAHKSGLVRGCLCMRCNKGLGYFLDNPDWLAAAADYLRNPPATQALGSPRFGLPGRVGTKKQRKLLTRLQKAASDDNILARIAIEGIDQIEREIARRK